MCVNEKYKSHVGTWGILTFLSLSLTLTEIKSCNGAFQETYLEKRSRVLKQEEGYRLGGDLTLSEKETKVNKLLMALKEKEIDTGSKPFGEFLPSRNFMLVKDKITKSPVFDVMRHMPKGAALHIHDASIGDVQWLVRNATYRQECFLCMDAKEQIHFHYFKSEEEAHKDKSCEWVQANKLRKASKNPEGFDHELYLNLTLGIEDWTSQDEIWTNFQKCFTGLFTLLSYAPVFQDYIDKAISEFYEDNVQYMEIRMVLSKYKVYELDGTVHDPEWLLKLVQSRIQIFKNGHQDFIGGKIIYCSSRSDDTTEIANDIKLATKLHRKYPDFLAGYDLVGQEDRGKPLLYYIKQLLDITKQNPADRLPFFFHAGETDWEDLAVDQNLIDAVLLNATRIGHGYAIVKHPVIMEMAAKKGIAIEVNPISNQVLGLVKDLRNHPATLLMAVNFPMVISSDDPTLWRASGLSYDFYEALMGLGGADANLATMKALVMNSIKYSAMTAAEKASALQNWQQQWDLFIEKMLHQYKL